MKAISILGATGSIGVSALDVVARFPGEFRIAALSAGSNTDLLAEQISRFRPRVVSVLDETRAVALREKIRHSGRIPEVVWGEEGYREAATVPEADIVLSAMVGAAGLMPTLQAIEAGKDIALANKETLVMAGKIVMEAARRKGVRILPVDSEHSAVFQCLEGRRNNRLRRILLTASGGPFLHLPLEKFRDVTVEDALNHPNWRMGKKITVDSATMMNKGLEMIEARWLFETDMDRIEVLVHPESIVHSMVEWMDGSVMAQMGVPDMRGPIAYALSYPDRLEGVTEPVTFTRTGKLTFLPPDPVRFPSLSLAYEAGKRGGTVPAVMNAANEVAVARFLAGQLRFIDIPAVVAECIERHRAIDAPDIGQILEADRQARAEAEKSRT
jgi:1-deoxy-D-xylulose-5-phosphate reductoisomerase